MTLEEAKSIKKGDRLVAAAELAFRSTEIYRVAQEPWISGDGTIVRFYLPTLRWVTFEGFVRAP